MALKSLQELYVEQLQDLRSAEEQILDALPKMIDAAKHEELRSGFNLHLHQTEKHLERLEGMLEGLGEESKGEKCKGMEGLLKEGADMMKKRADSDVLDAGLIAAAQRVEHYEIAGYGCARTYAAMLGHNEHVRLLQQTLDEEAATDKKLTSLAERVINIDAAIAGESRDRSARGASQPEEPGMAPRYDRPEVR
ncbi:MAG: ferritin-like domain-containing protein [Gemmatimonadaceae bacterium]